MELCAISLDAYIQRKWSSVVMEKLPQFVKVDSLSTDLQWAQIRTIATDTASGIAFLHTQKAIHRDLKPANGTPSALACLLTVDSPVFL